MLYLHAMNVSLSETVELGARREQAWSVLANIENMPMFSGFGPIPGIAQARWVQGDGCRQGAVREVRNRDGTSHREDVVTAVEPQCLEDRIYGFTSPLRFLVREARDRFELCEHGDRTLLTRTFTLELRSALTLPLAGLLLPLLRRAIRCHHAALREHLREGHGRDEVDKSITHLTPLD